jgi:hypothetical protein
LAGLSLKAAVTRIERNGILLVFPIDNRKEPGSLWSAFFPRSQMRWEWDEGGDRRVPAVWHLREQLSRSGKVVYSKWYRGRATFFSREIFSRILAVARERIPDSALGSEARAILELVEESSPLSTKELKKRSKLQGRFQEATYNRALKELWTALRIVGFGEVDDGAFPSLAIGATAVMFEDLWRESARLDTAAALAEVREALPEGSAFRKEFEKLLAFAPARPKGPSVFHYGGW